jgi:hypothetical protein
VLEKLAVFAADQIVLDPKLRLLTAAKQDRQTHGKRPLLLDRRHNVEANDHDGRGGLNGATENWQPKTGRLGRPSPS